MEKNIIRNTLLTAAITAALSSCDFLEEYSQDQAYITSWEDLNELLIGGCYMKVGATDEFHNSSNPGQFLHLLADEMDERNITTTGLTQFDAKYYTFGYYTWQQRAGIKETYAGDYYKENTTWTYMYKCINVANNILKSSESLPQTTQEQRKGYLKVRGEAHFLRGFYYFWLTNVYGQPYSQATASSSLGVPVKTSEEVLDIKFERNSVKECYDQLVEDLLAAEKELTEYGTAKKSIYRADSTAVQLLLSRVYLYMQNWSKAEEYARKIIKTHPELQNLNSDKSRIMIASNTENIFSMGGDDLPTMLLDEVSSYKINPDLYKSYSDNDIRKREWMYTFSTFYGLTKQAESSSYVDSYKQTDALYNYYCYYMKRGTQSPISSLFWLRSAEAYLNLAEALAYQGIDSEALETLNTLRSSRYLPGSQELTKTYSNEELANEIRQERRKELAFEGHRWFDLRRYRVCEKYPSKTEITHTYTYYSDRGSNQMTETHVFTLGKDDNSWTCPIPQEVIDFNTGMKNNGNKYREYTVTQPIEK